MAKGIMFAFTAAKPGHREDLNQWYDEQHVPDLLDVPGVTDATRYDLRLIKMPDGFPELDFLAAYSMDGDIEAIYREIGSRMGPDRLSPHLDSGKTIAYLAYPKTN